MCLYEYNYQNFVVIFAQVFGATQSKCCLVFASLNPFLFTRTQVLHCRSAHTQSRAGMKQFTRSLSISLWKLLLGAERIYLSWHKRLLPLSNCHLKQLMFGENLPHWSAGRSGSDSQILIYNFGSSLFLMIPVKVKIDIEEFKEDISPHVIDRPSVEEYLA